MGLATQDRWGIIVAILHSILEHLDQPGAGGVSGACFLCFRQCHPRYQAVKVRIVRLRSNHACSYASSTVHPSSIHSSSVSSSIVSASLQPDHRSAPMPLAQMSLFTKLPIELIQQILLWVCFGFMKGFPDNLMNIWHMRRVCRLFQKEVEALFKRIILSRATLRIRKCWFSQYSAYMSCSS